MLRGRRPVPKGTQDQEQGGWGWAPRTGPPLCTQSQAPKFLSSIPTTTLQDSLSLLHGLLAERAQPPDGAPPQRLPLLGPSIPRDSPPLPQLSPRSSSLTRTPPPLCAQGPSPSISSLSISSPRLPAPFPPGEGHPHSAGSFPPWPASDWDS